MIVVTQEKPGGSNRRYGSDTSRRNARSPELRSGILLAGQPFGELADDPLRRHPEDLVRALLAGSGADYLIDIGVVDEVAHELGNALVRVGHVGVGPHDDLATGVAGADPADGARTTVAAERDNRMFG